MVIMAAEGTRYRCGRCGNALVVAESGALKGFTIHCRRCDRYNEVPL
jgi:DNA-directed RNA polymerase subunit RPC12/RpoP